MRIACLLKAWRHHEELSIRDAAKRVGIPASTYARIEEEKTMSAETLVHVWSWMLES